MQLRFSLQSYSSTIPKQPLHSNLVVCMPLVNLVAPMGTAFHPEPKIRLILFDRMYGGSLLGFKSVS